MHWNGYQRFELSNFVPSPFDLRSRLPHPRRSCSASAGRDSLRSVSLTPDAATLLALEHHSAHRLVGLRLESLRMFRFVSSVNATGFRAIPPVFSSASMHSLLQFDHLWSIDAALAIQAWERILLRTSDGIVPSGLQF